MSQNKHTTSSHYQTGDFKNPKIEIPTKLGDRKHFNFLSLSKKKEKKLYSHRSKTERFSYQQDFSKNLTFQRNRPTAFRKKND